MCLLMTRRLEDRPHWQIALLLTMVMRIVYSTAAAVFSLFLHPDPQLVRSNRFIDSLPSATGVHYAWLDIWQRFDTLWYLHIAAQRYDRPAALALFPLYPLLIRAVSFVLSPIAAALLISTVSAFFLFWGFGRLASLDLPPSAVVRGALLYAIWPASFILFAGYADGMAIALIVWAIYFGRKQQWWAAAICGGAAGLVRAVGAVAFVTLAVLAMRIRQARSWPVLLSGVGAVAYPAWLRISRHVSLTDVYRHYWQIRIVPPWITLWHVARALVANPDIIFVTNLVVLVLLCILVTHAPRRLEYGVYSGIVVLQILMRFEYPLLLGAARYLLALFPAFLGLARISVKPWFERQFWLVCILLLACNLAWLWSFLGWKLIL